MRIIFLLSIILCAGFGANAQITLTDADIGATGSTYYLGVDSSLDSTFTLGNPGPNQTWNFSALGIDDLDTINFLDPSLTPYGADFPTSNLCITQGSTPGYAYLEYNSSLLQIIGLAGDPANIGQIFILEQEDPLVVATFPFTYGDVTNDTSIIDVTIAYSVFPGTDSVRYRNVVNRELTGDAYGDLNLYSGTFNTLRVKDISQASDSIWIHSIFGWTLAQDSMYTDSTFTWWGNGAGYILAEASYSGPVLTDISYQDPNIVSNVKPLALQFETFPNPATDRIIIRREKSTLAELELVNLQGQLMWQGQSKSFETEISVSDFPPGTYLLKIRDPKSGIVNSGKISIAH